MDVNRNVVVTDKLLNSCEMKLKNNLNNLDQISLLILKK